MVISEDTRDAIDSECAKYPQKRGGLLPAMHLVQKQLGHIAPETAVELAEIFDIRPVEVMEVLTFYNMFFSAPRGRHNVYVCTNLPCALRGSRTLLAQIESHLGIAAGETTEDGRISLGHEECLGACAYAPMLRVDETYHENLDLEKANQILDGLE
ncbi:MAG: NAD(P)H-dependent oxidoreductase subunit E [Proteobacteria bacterium]|nr:NAD(P)H-dependent oxidoreductase subunit E [Pseudomonadota bacterium]